MIERIAIVIPSLLFVAALFWRTQRQRSAHTKIKALQAEVEDLKAWKEEIEALRNRNPYEWLNITHRRS